MYIRFVIPSLDENLGLRKGVFTAAYKLKRHPELASYELEILEDLLDWFRNHLNIPDKLYKGSGKNKYHTGHMPAISWFKPTSVTHIAKIRELSALLEEHGYRVEMIKTSKPGYVVYEDDHQIAAIPVNDTNT